MEYFIYFLIGIVCGIGITLGAAIWMTKAAEKERKLKRADKWKR